MESEEIIAKAKQLEKEQLELNFTKFLSAYNELERQYGFTHSSRPILTEDGRIGSELIIVKYINKGG